MSKETALIVLILSAPFVFGCNRSSEIAKGLSSNNVEERRKAAQDLAALEKGAAAQVPTLVDSAVEDEDREVRVTAASALASFPETQRKKALDLLSKKAMAEETEHRIHALEAIGKFQANAAPAVPALIQSLRDKNPEVRATAAATIGRVGPTASNALPELLTVLSDEQGKVCVSALGAIYHLKGQEKSEAAIRAACKHPDEEARKAALHILSSDHTVGGRNLEVFIEHLDEESTEVVKSAIKALSDIGPAAKPALPKLRETQQKHKDNYDINRMLGDVIGRLEKAGG